MTFDVAVVGGGPAGASAALWLARAGSRVALLEKAALPRHKTCGGGLVGRALADLPGDVGFPVERACRVVEARFPELGLRVTVRRDEPIVHMVTRAAFDQALVEAAAGAGAAVEAPCALLDLRPASGGVELETSRGPLRAAFVVGADGALGETARRAGWPRPVTAVPALEAEVRLPEAALLPFADVARFDMGLPGQGYGWLFPKRGHLSAGLLTMQRGPARLRERLARYLAGVGVREPAREECHGYVIPVRPRWGGAVRGRVLLAEDAAGLADPLTGEGLSLAIRTGRLAAEALAAGAPDPGAVAAAYRARLRPLLAELRIARLLAHVLYRRSGLVRRLLPRVGQQAGEALTDVFLGARTYRSLVGRAATYRRLLAALSLAPGA